MERRVIHDSDKLSITEHTGCTVYETADGDRIEVGTAPPQDRESPPEAAGAIYPTPPDDDGALARKLWVERAEQVIEGAESGAVGVQPGAPTSFTRRFFQHSFGDADPFSSWTYDPDDTDLRVEGLRCTDMSAPHHPAPLVIEVGDTKALRLPEGFTHYDTLELEDRSNAEFDLSTVDIVHGPGAERDRLPDAFAELVSHEPTNERGLDR